MQVVNETTLLKRITTHTRMQSSLKLSINFYQQVKFTRPLTSQDCGSLVTYWRFHQLIDPTASEKATD